MSYSERKYRKANGTHPNTPERKKYLSELGKARRDRGLEGKLQKMGKDLSHDSKGNLKLESRKVNRGNNNNPGRRRYRKD